MSYILDALKKSDAERKRGEVPTLADAPAFGGEPTPSARPWPWIIAGALGVAVAVLSGVLLWRTSPAPEAQSETPEQIAQAPTPAPETATPAPTEPQAEPPAETPHPEAQPAETAAATPEPEPQPQAAFQPEAQTEPVAQAEAMPEPMPEPEPEPELEPAPEPVKAEAPVATPAPAPVPAPAPAATPEPIAAPQEVGVLRAQPAPKPTAESAPAKPVRVEQAPLKSAAAYVQRAWQAMGKSLYTQAIADLDAALGVEPAYADAWFARGWAQEKSGDAPAAIADYGRAVDIQPRHAEALFSRGFLKLYGGDPAGAALDFTRTQGVANDAGLRLYSHLWLYLARARAGQDAKGGLKSDAANESLVQWPGPLVLHYMGALDEGSVQGAIEGGATSGIMERRVTGFFFLGALAEQVGDSARARTYFERTLATGLVDYRQYEAAKRELERLGR